MSLCWNLVNRNQREEGGWRCGFDPRLSDDTENDELDDIERCVLVSGRAGGGRSRRVVDVAQIDAVTTIIKQTLEPPAIALNNVERDVSPYWIGHRFEKQGAIVFRRRSPRERDLLFRPLGQAARFDRFRSRHVRPFPGMISHPPRPRQTAGLRPKSFGS
jgi:hypothetical protein